MKRLAAIVLGVGVFAVAATGTAATPPPDLMEIRLRQAREAREPTRANVRVTIVAGGATDHSATVDLVSNKPLKLQAKSGETLDIGGDSKDGDVGATVGWLLLAGDVIATLNSLGDFRPSETGVEVLSDAFGYRYGGRPSIVVSRDLSRVLKVAWQVDGISFEAEFTHSAGGDWPESIAVSRAGRPFLRVSISPSKPAKE